MKFGTIGSIFLMALVMAAGCAALSKEFVLHDYKSLTFNAIRPSTSEAMLNPHVTVEGIRDEPEYVLVTEEYGLIADFVVAINMDGPLAICPTELVLTWVADFDSNGTLDTFAGNHEYARASDGSCRKIDQFSAGQLLK